MITSIRRLDFDPSNDHHSKCECAIIVVSLWTDSEIDTVITTKFY